jgi:hypothetical protein
MFTYIKYIQKIIYLTIYISSQLYTTQAQAQIDKKTYYVSFITIDQESKNTLYTGQEKIQLIDGQYISRKTCYYDLNKQVIKIERALFNKDSLKIIRLIDQEKIAKKQTKIQTIDKNKITVFFKKEDEQDSDSFDWNPKLVVNKTLNQFIIKNKKKLLHNKEVNFKLLVPSRVDIFSFDLTRDTKLSTEKKLVVAMDASSFFVRLFVPKIYFTYKIKDNRLQLESYTGPSVIDHKDKKYLNTKTRISYHNYLKLGCNPDKELL